MMNVGGGNVYALGEYDQANESWTTVIPAATIDHGPDSAWMAGQFAGGRFVTRGCLRHELAPAVRVRRLIRAIVGRMATLRLHCV